MLLVTGDRDDAVTEVASEGRGLGFNPSLDDGLVIGDVARLADGAVARVNGVRRDVSLPPGAPEPPAGMKLIRLDVELCAGERDLFVDAAFWLGLGNDEKVHSAHLGVRDLFTLTMAPGSCQRGSVDLALPDDIALKEVLLSDTTQATAARWSVDGSPGELTPLRSAVMAETIGVGAPADLVTGGSVTLHRFTGDAETSGDGGAGGTTGIRIEVEVCAGEQAVTTSPRFWFVQLDDHRLVRAERDGSTTQSRELDPDTCEQDTAEFSVPVTARPVAVVYASGGMFEAGRWDLGT